MLAMVAACASTSPHDDRMREPLAPAGDAARGRELFATRDEARCVLCHAVPGLSPAGDLGPALDHVGARLDAAQIRLRIADITRVRPDAAMPTFHRTDGMVRVAPRFAGQPVLTAQQVEDLVAYLETLR
jgi:sulfur-oxidizing protein SoxX